MALASHEWSQSFYASLAGEPALSAELREASISGNLTRWTASLTRLVVGAFQRLGLEVAAKGHRGSVLPVPRGEYLALDATALPAEGGVWRFPVAVCELENSSRDEVVAYALWKVLCIRSALRVVFCYRSARTDGTGMVAALADQVVGAMTLSERQNLAGDTLLFVGSRSESSTFPYGFFRAWRLNHNTGRFETYAWQA